MGKINLKMDMTIVKKTDDTTKWKFSLKDGL